jgi:hypothetical protein
MKESAEFVLVQMKGRLDKGYGRVLLADNAGGGPVVLRWIRSGVLRFQLDFLYIVGHLYSQFRLARVLPVRNYRLGLGVSVLGRGIKGCLTLSDLAWY